MTEMVVVPRGASCAAVCGGGCGGNETPKEGSSKEHQNHLSLVALIIAALRKSMAACRVDDLRDETKSTKPATLHQMEIGWPTDVQHLTHVTFDRFHGFLGLPVEFEVEIPCRVPSASCKSKKKEKQIQFYKILRYHASVPFKLQKPTYSDAKESSEDSKVYLKDELR